MRPFRFGVLGERIRSCEGLLAEARRAEALGYSTLLMRDHFVREPFSDQLVGRPVGVASHKRIQHGPVRLGDSRVQQRRRGDHQHTADALVAGWVQAQAEVTVPHSAGHKDLAVGVAAELRHWPAPAAGGWGHQATRPDQDVDLRQPVSQSLMVEG